jgi:hypothetical protein
MHFGLVVDDRSKVQEFAKQTSGNLIDGPFLDFLDASKSFNIVICSSPRNWHSKLFQCDRIFGAFTLSLNLARSCNAAALRDALLRESTGWANCLTKTGSSGHDFEAMLAQ